MTLRTLDIVVLNEDVPAHGLKRGDLGTVVEIYAPDALEVEFVTASGRTQALVTLPPSAVREVGDNDLVAVRPVAMSNPAMELTPLGPLARPGADAAHRERWAD